MCMCVCTVFSLLQSQLARWLSELKATIKCSRRCLEQPTSLFVAATTTHGEKQTLSTIHEMFASDSIVAISFPFLEPLSL